MSIDIRNSSTQYGLVARILHWTSVAMLLTLIVIASQFSDKDAGPDKQALVIQHSSIGMLFLMVMLARLTRRSLTPNPIQSCRDKGWQKRQAMALHRSVYRILIAQCILGLLILLTRGEPWRFYSLLEVP